MKNKIYVLITLLILLSCVILSEEKFLVYEERTKKKVTTHRFEIKTHKSGYLINLISETCNKKIFQKYMVDFTFATLYWDYSDDYKKTKHTRHDRSFAKTHH